MNEVVNFLNYVDFEERFNSYLDEVYTSLASVEYAKIIYSFANDPKLSDYESLKSDYEQVQEATNENAQNIFKVANALLGF